MRPADIILTTRKSRTNMTVLLSLWDVQTQDLIPALSVFSRKLNAM